MQYFVDTNIFLRLFIREDNQTFQETKGVIKLINEGKIKAFTSHLAMAELEWTMKSYYQILKKDRLVFLEAVLRLKNLKLVDNFDLTAALNFYRNYQVKFIDCLFASNPLISSGKAVIISYDKDFDSLKIKRIKPGDIKDIS